MTPPAASPESVLWHLRTGLGLDDVHVRLGLSYREIFSVLAANRHATIRDIPMEPYLVLCAKRIRREADAA